MSRLIISSVLFALLGFALSCGHTKNSKKVLSVPTLQLETVQDLTLAKPLEKGRGAFVSAASGVVQVGTKYYFVSDDDQYLFVLGAGEKNVQAHKLLPENLEGVADRKAAKADFESLVHLTSDQWPPYGAIVAWPSGSTPNRMRAVTVPFEKNGALGKPIVSDILPLAYRLQAEVKELNIEGLLVRDKKVFLFQRGNSAKGKNAIIEMSLANWLKGLKSKDWSGKLNTQNVKIGTLSGVNLTFSDVVWTRYGLLALASAEDSTSAYADGVIYGTVLVRIVNNNAEVLAKFAPVTKLEGITATEAGEGLDLHLVDDADSPAKASRLYRVHVFGDLLGAVYRSKR